MGTLQSMADVATKNPRTVGVWLLGWAFAVLSAAALVQAVRVLRRGDLRRGVRLHALLVALACCGLAAYLWHWHLIGLRLWAW
jgi:hypothetical protein